MNTIILFLGVFFLPFAQAADLKTVSVKGQGEVKVIPDQAELYLEVRAKAKEAQAAQSKNAKEMARVEKVLKSDFKIEAKDIQSSGFNVSPDYRFDQAGKRNFLGFVATHSLRVNYKNMEKLGALLDALAGKGTEEVATLLQNMNFGSSQRQAHEIRALGEAMKNAEGRAEALAKFSHLGLKGVLRIADSNVNFQPPPYPREFAKAMSGGIMTEAQADTGSRIQPGEITINADVSVEYRLD